MHSLLYFYTQRVADMLQRVRGVPDDNDVNAAPADADDDSTTAAAAIDEARLIELAQAGSEGKLSLDMLSLDEQKLFMRAATGGVLSR
jgi:hypothetical protein